MTCPPLTFPGVQNVCAAGCSDGKVTLYRRINGGVTGETFSFAYPLLHSGEPFTADGRKLAGNGELAALDFYPCREDWEKAEKTAAEKGLAVRNFRDDLGAAIADLGFRFFGGMEFFQLVRMQIKVDFAALTATMLCKERVWEISGSDGAGFVSAICAAVAEADPDVIEGEELYSVIIPDLAALAKKHKTTLALGRDGGEVVIKRSRYTAGGRQINCNNCIVNGRHLVDLTVLAVIHDGIHRELDDYSLDSLKEFFDLHGTDCEIIRALSDMWLPSFFYRAMFLPVSLQSVILRGSGSMLDALLVDACCRQGLAVPLPDAAESFEGALSRSENSGVFRRVMHCDVRSLYPSILLSENISPRKDHTGIFLHFLRTLRDFRLAAREKMHNAASEVEKREAGALQSAFKILINSFYGYLGFAQGVFNDYALAAKVTSRGREIMNLMLDFLQKAGCRIIELDTDGIYFQLPEQGNAADIEEDLQDILPSGIKVEFDEMIPAMFSYKSKNYALLKSDGKIEITGAALKSRALEPFIREALAFGIDALLRDQQEKIAPYFEKLSRDITEHSLPLAKLAKCETLNDSTANYSRKLAAGKGRRSAAYELLIAAGISAGAGRKVRFYVTGTGKKVPVVDNSALLADDSPRNENVAYYLEKCRGAEEIFREFLK